MISSEPLLKTRQVASALGVSGATVKRWVDAGLIRAVRTAGKHRLVPISEVKRMAADRGTSLTTDWLRAAQDSGSTAADHDRIVAPLVGLLRDGNAADSRSLIRTISRSSHNGADLADRVIGPVMERIGHGWMVGSLDVYQEHLASTIVTAALQERIDEVTLERLTPRPGPLAIGATSEGDFYVIPGLLAELSLRELGWDVRNLGTNLPLRSLANAAREFRPRLIFLSINHLKDEDRFLREYQAFYGTAAGVEAAVIVGGRALRPELRSQLPYAAFGDRMSHLAEFARRLTPRETAPASTTTDSAPADREATRSPEHHG